MDTECPGEWSGQVWSERRATWLGWLGFAPISLDCAELAFLRDCTVNFH